MRFSYRQRYLLYAELAKMLRAGFGLDRAAETILAQNPPAAQKRYLDSLLGGLGEGLGVAETLRRTGPDLKIASLETALVEAGEKGGKLEQSFDHLSEYFEVLDRTRNRVRVQLIYPLILLHLAVILPAIPRAIVAGDSGVFVRSTVIGLVVLYLGAGLLVLLGKWMNDRARVVGPIDTILRRLPLAGVARRYLAMHRFCSVFHIYLLAASPVSVGLRAAGAASQSAGMAARADAGAAGIEAGNSLAAALAPAGRRETVFPEEFTRSLATAEESGTLDEDLARWGRHYRESSLDALDRAGTWMVKIIYLGVVMFVVWQILRLATGYFDTLNQFLEMPG